MTGTLVKAELKIEPRYIQAVNEDGERYDYQSGYYLTAYENRKHGQAQYTCNKAFTSYNDANVALNRYCGDTRNAFRATIEEGVDSHQFTFSGASY